MQIEMSQCSCWCSGRLEKLWKMLNDCSVSSCLLSGGRGSFERCKLTFQCAMAIGLSNMEVYLSMSVCSVYGFTRELLNMFVCFSLCS